MLGDREPAALGRRFCLRVGCHMTARVWHHRSTSESDARERGTEERQYDQLSAKRHPGGSSVPIAWWHRLARRPGRRWRAAKAIALQNQILELRRQVQGLQDAAGRARRQLRPISGAARTRRLRRQQRLVAQLLTRVDALEEQVRQLRGRVDETQNQVQRQGADLGKRIDDLAFQVRNPGGSRAAAARPPPAPAAGTAPPPGLGLPPPSAAAAAAAAARARSGARRRLSMQEGNAALARRD